MVRATYLDGRSTRIRIVDLSMDGDDLIVAGDDFVLREPFSRVRVDERLGRAPRKLRFEDGALCEVRDLDALDALLLSVGYRDGRVARMQNHLKSVLVAFIACLALSILAYRFVLPWAAAEGARRMSPVVGKTLSVQVLRAMDGAILKPSGIAPERQRRLSVQFHALYLPEGGHPQWALLFRASPQLGANAFTLPDGTIVVLDDLIKSMDNDGEVLAVVAHELGHARGQHGLQLLLRSSAVGAFWALYVGDVSHLLSAAPAALVQARYSRDLEQEADDYGASILANNGMSPALLADALRQLVASHPESSRSGYLSSHPSMDERMRHLRSLGRGSTD